MKRVLTVVWATGLWMSASADPQSELDDAHARSQYAFYTADNRSLEQLAGSIERLEVPPSLIPMKAYNAAYARWKLAQLQGEAVSPGSMQVSRSLGVRSAQDCLRLTKAALKLDPKMTEAYVLDAACDMLAHEQRTGESRSTSPCTRSRSLRTAQELDPDNPRVMLIAALCLQGNDTASATAAFDRLRAVVAAFEGAPASRPGSPHWGQAEALVLLGENYLQRGDTHAARDVIEKALVIAPDYGKARGLLDMAAARPR